MIKKVYRLMSAILALALTIGNYYGAQASSATAEGPLQNPNAVAETWSVTKSYIVDKDNIGGKGCNDSWPATVDQPLCTVTAGLALVQPGQGLFLRAGTYPNFTVTRSGTNTTYLSIASYNGEKAIISGGSEGILLKGVSYVRIYGLEVKGATGNWLAGIRVVASSAGFPSHNIIENNIVHDNVGINTTGILIENGSYNKIINNKVYNNYMSGIVVISHVEINPYGITGNEVIGNESYNNTLGAGDADGIQLQGPGTKNTLVMYNIVHGNSDDGIDTWNTSYNTIVGNISYGQVGPGDGNGFKLGGGNTGGHNIIKQNVAYGNKFNGFDSNGSGGNVFYNNVAYNNINFGFEDGWKDASCASLSCQQTFINNIGYNNVLGNFSASAYTTVSHNNLWYSDAGSAKVFYNYTAFSSLAAFYLASGNRLDNPSGGELASVQANPQFTNASSGIFTVLPTSPVIDKGDAVNPGQVLAINRVDIGAFENSASAATSTSLASTQTPMATFTPTSIMTSPTVTQALVLPTTTSTSVAPTITASLMPVSPTFTATASLISILPTFTPTYVLPTATTQAIIPPALETLYDDMNRAIGYSSGWQNVSDPQAYGSSYKVADRKGASITLGFTGQSFSVLYTSGPSYRSMDVYVDGVLVGTIDQKTSSTQFQQRWNYPGQLTLSAHTVILVTKNRNNTYISIDGVIVR